MYAESLQAAQQAYRAFITKWERRAPKVAESLQEAGEEFWTCSHFPKRQWKALRTTNAIERFHEEFWRRVKTQGSLPNAQAAESLLFGLVCSGQIRMRRIDGWQEEVHPVPPACAVSSTADRSRTQDAGRPRPVSDRGF